MTQLLQRFERKHMVWLVNALVFSFFVTVLTFKKGYSYAPMTLAGIGIIYLFVHIFKLKKPLNFTKEDKWLIFAFLFYFGTFAFSAVYHGDGWREIDNPSRVLLFIPLLLLFREFPINIKVILHGVPIGAAVAGIIAIYQKFILGIPRAFTEFMAIQGGDIAMSLAGGTIAIAIYFLIEKQFIFSIIYTLFSLLGIMGSILSGSRGAWLSLPIMLFIVLIIYRKRISWKFWFGGFSAIIIIFTSLYHIPNIGVKERVDVINKEIVGYIDNKNKYSSLGARFDMWKSATLAFKDKPVLGWGSKDYLELKKQQQKEKVIHKTAVHFNDAHNQYLDALAKRGILGLFGLLFIFIIPIKIFCKDVSSSKENQIMATMMIIHIGGVAVYCLSQSFLSHNSGSIFYFFIMLSIYQLIHNKKAKP